MPSPRVVSISAHVSVIDAERWRSQFLGLLRSTKRPGALHRDLLDGIERRAWTRLEDERGKPFRSFSQFCRSPQPWGLETDEDEVRDALEALLGKRRAKLLLVAPSKQGARHDLLPPGADVPLKTRQDARLAAIVDRAPESVRKLYEAGAMSAKEAERFARSKQTAEEKKAIQGFTRWAARKSAPTRAEVKERLAETFVVEDEDQEGVVYTARVGLTADLLPDVLRLHVPRGSTIADVTHGRGSMWKRVPKSAYRVLATDLSTGVDLRDLPYDDASLDAVVLDPPWMWISSGGSTTGGTDLEARYQNKARGTQTHAAVVALYVDGAKEAKRVLRPGGTLIVKVQDEVAHGRQCLTHVEIIMAAAKLGLTCVDLFVLVQPGKPMTPSWMKTQKHARKNHSFVLVMRKS